MIFLESVVERLARLIEDNVELVLGLIVIVVLGYCLFAWGLA